MRFEASISEQDWNESVRLTRKWDRWVDLIRQHLYMAVLLAALLVAALLSTARQIIGSDENWGETLLLWCLFAGFSWAARWAARQERSRTRKKLQSFRPCLFDISAAGIRVTHQSGKEDLIPWSTYDRYREGKRVVILRPANKRHWDLLPVAALSDVERAELAGMLTSHIRYQQRTPVAPRIAANQIPADRTPTLESQIRRDSR